MKCRCPNCKAFTDYTRENPFRPFCSERCKLIDLGEWLAEEHRIGTEGEADFVESGREITRH